MWPFRPSTLDTLVPTLVRPAEDVSQKGLLPCEHVFQPVQDKFTSDVFDRLRDETKLDPKRIPWSSLQKTKAGFLGLQVPVFDLVNPFHQHAEGPLETSLFFMKEWIRATRGDQKYTNQNIQNYGGVLIIQ